MVHAFRSQRALATHPDIYPELPTSPLGVISALRNLAMGMKPGPLRTVHRWNTSLACCAKNSPLPS